jgi:adenylylsulfate kinase
MENIHPIFERSLTRDEKENFLNQNSKVFWFTGLSGSGKSTIALGLEKKLFDEGFFVQLLDGDNIRTGINNNLGFSLEDRKENIRRIAEVSNLFCTSGIICLNSFVSPTYEIRSLAKEIIGEENFFEIFVNTPLEICEHRDVKGLYKKARKGKIKNFTGIDSTFEVPKNPFLEIKTETQTIEESVNFTFDSIKNLIKKI